MGQDCSSVLNHQLGPGFPSAETSSKPKMPPPGSTSSQDPEFPLKEENKHQLDVLRGSVKERSCGGESGTGKGHQQQGKPGATEWILGPWKVDMT